MRIDGTEKGAAAEPGGDVAIFRRALKDAAVGFLGNDYDQVSAKSIETGVSCLLEVQWAICRQTGMTPAQFALWLSGSAKHVADNFEAVLAKQHCNA